MTVLKSDFQECSWLFVKVVLWVLNDFIAKVTDSLVVQSPHWQKS